MCAGTPVIFTGGGADTYVWTGGVTDGIEFYPSSTNSYTVTGTDDNNCSATATITVIINALPIVTVNANVTTFCAGTSVILSGGGASTYIWTDGVIDGVGFVPSFSNTYTVTGTDIFNCSNTADVSLIVNTAPIIVTEPEDQIADIGSSASFSVIATGTDLTYQWRIGTSDLSDGGNISGATSATLIINPVNIYDYATDYNVVITGTCAPITTSVDVSLLDPTKIDIFQAENTKTAVTIFPNPFTTSINIIINDSTQIKKTEMRIYNVFGAEVMNTTLTKRITTLEISNLPSGVYFYKLFQNRVEGEIGNDKIIQSGKLISQQ